MKKPSPEWHAGKIISASEDAFNCRPRSTKSPRLGVREAYVNVLNALACSSEADEIDRDIEEIGPLQVSKYEKNLFCDALQRLGIDPEPRLPVDETFFGISALTIDRERPSSKLIRQWLRDLTNKIGQVPGADRFRAAAMLVSLMALDRLPIFKPEVAPIGRARVKWLTQRIRELTRTRDGEYSIRKLKNNT